MIRTWPTLSVRPDGLVQPQSKTKATRHGDPIRAQLNSARISPSVRFPILLSVRFRPSSQQRCQSSKQASSPPVPNPLWTSKPFGLLLVRVRPGRGVSPERGSEQGSWRPLTNDGSGPSLAGGVEACEWPESAQKSQNPDDRILRELSRRSPLPGPGDRSRRVSSHSIERRVCSIPGAGQLR
jgi:hypothetical protein